MNWQSIKFDWNHARAFLVTAEEGSYSAAAKALGVSQPTLGRQVASLERQLGIALFERVGKGITLTPNGHALLDYVKQMSEAANAFALAAAGQANSIEGSICISASEALAAYILAPMIQKLRIQAPELQIEIIASNKASDLRKREADIAIRNFQPTENELIARRLDDGHAFLYASPAYLQRLPHPITQQSLSKAEFVGFADNTELIAGLNNAGLNLSDTNFNLTTESHLVHWELVKSGLAIGIMPNLIGDAESKVQRVLPDMPPLIYENWLVAHRELRTNRRVRLVYDFLAEELSNLSKKA